MCGLQTHSKRRLFSSQPLWVCCSNPTHHEATLEGPHAWARHAVLTARLYPVCPHLPTHALCGEKQTLAAPGWILILATAFESLPDFEAECLRTWLRSGSPRLALEVHSCSLYPLAAQPVSVPQEHEVAGGMQHLRLGATGEVHQVTASISLQGYPGQSSYPSPEALQGQEAACYVQTHSLRTCDFSFLCAP